MAVQLLELSQQTTGSAAISLIILCMMLTLWMHEFIPLWILQGVSTGSGDSHHWCSLSAKGKLMFWPCCTWWGTGSGSHLVPRPHPQEERVWGHWDIFLILRTITWSNMLQFKPMLIYMHNHMIAELAEPSISANVPRPFSSWRWDLGTRLSQDSYGNLSLLRATVLICGLWGG